MIGPHAFHVIAGFILAALLVVCGFMFGPSAEDDQVEPISSGSLAAYLFGATLIVLNSGHADTAITGSRCWWPAPCSSPGARSRTAGASPPHRYWPLWCSPNGPFAAIRKCWCCPADRCPASAPPRPTVR